MHRLIGSSPFMIATKSNCFISQNENDLSGKRKGENYTAFGVQSIFKAQISGDDKLAALGCSDQRLLKRT
jgi:hypothetical protein